jgi:hypothetical protein
MTNSTARTANQQAVIAKLEEIFGLSSEDTEGILFLKPNKPLKPWLPYDVALAIARQSPDLRSVTDRYVDYITALQQVVHSATVTDSKGREFTCTGIATIGETLPNEDIPDEHRLAKARGLNGALDMAGLNPLKTEPQVLDLKLSGQRESAILDEAAARSKDLRQIHALAHEKGLIKLTDDEPPVVDISQYLQFLTNNFGVNSAAKMQPVERAQLINKLTFLPDLETGRVVPAA